MDIQSFLQMTVQVQNAKGHLLGSLWEMKTANSNQLDSSFRVVKEMQSDYYFFIN